MNPPEFFVNNGNLLCRVEIFNWLSPDEKTSIRFHITEMLLAISSGKLKHTPVLARLDNNFARDWLTKREPNMDYVRQLSPNRLKEPVLGARLPDADDSVVLIDGTHRYYATLPRRTLLCSISSPCPRRLASIRRNQRTLAMQLALTHGQGLSLCVALLTSLSVQINFGDSVTGIFSMLLCRYLIFFIICWFGGVL